MRISEAGLSNQRVSDPSRSDHYWAFISYSHSDVKWARWLHKALEHYRAPRRLVGAETVRGNVPTNLVPVFLDRLELSAGDDLDIGIMQALRQSRTLIVLCSPAAVASARVKREIELFKTHNGGKILAVLLAGRPNARFRGLDPAQECFPNDLFSFSGGQSIEPLAADLRPGRGGRQEALLKLVAGILDVSFDQLRQRDLQRRRARWMAVSAASFTGMILAGGLALFAWQQRSVALNAQARLLTETALDKLHAGDIESAQGIILEVLGTRRADDFSDSTLAAFREIVASDPQLAVLMGHTARVLHAEFSRDGRRVVTASYDGSASIWDASTGARLQTFRHPAGRVFFAAFSPDGSRVATAGEDGSARVWDAASGLQLALFDTHQGMTRFVAFSPNGEDLLTTSESGGAGLWNISGKTLKAALIGHIKRVVSGRFSPDGRWVVTISRDGTGRVWDAATGRATATLAGHTAPLTCVAFSPDSRRIITGSADKSLRMWDWTGRPVPHELYGHTAPVRAVAFSPDGARIATTGQDGVLRVWDAASGAQIFATSGRLGWLISVTYSPDGGEIATTSSERSAQIWDARTGALLSHLMGHTDHVMDSNFSSDGRRLVTASEDGTARIWRAIPGNPIRVFRGHEAQVDAVAFSRNGRQISTASDDQTARVWDVGASQAVLTVDGFSDAVTRTDFSPDGRVLLTSSRNMAADLWDVTSKQHLGALLGHTSSVESAAFSRDGEWIITGSQDQTARLWSSRTFALVQQFIGHHDRVLSAALSVDNSQVATGSQDHTARIWDAHTGAQLAVLAGHTSNVNSVAFSPDGNRLVTAGDDATIRVWDVHNAVQVALLTGHRGSVDSATFSPDGRYIVSASDDRTIRVWEAKSFRLLQLLTGHTEGVRGAVISEDGQYLASGSMDGTARLWAVVVPANIEAQTRWYAAAQFEPLSTSSRAQLGLPPAPDPWKRHPPSLCELALSAYYDPHRNAPGTDLQGIVVPAADQACASEFNGTQLDTEHQYLLARLLAAKKQFLEASRRLEQTIQANYGPAYLDLGDLYNNTENSSFDVRKAAFYFEGAWRHGITLAATRLAQLCESQALPKAPGSIEQCLTSSGDWYGAGAKAGEPTALARFAEQDEFDFSRENDNASRKALLLSALKFYIRATDSAESKHIPDFISRVWRYRRANVAHALGDMGMIEQVAAAFPSSRTQ